jgi:streptomycin 6-kinase
VSTPLASGREADVFALDDDRVLRRYRRDADVTDEAEAMAYVAGLGFPVPRVYAAHGADMVLERLHGPTLLRAMRDGDLPIEDGAAVLADLLRRLHELPGRSGGESVLHLDLHPDNVILTGRGPVVIDWCNVADGQGDFDTALSALIVAMVTDDPQVDRFLDAFLRLAPGDPRRLLDEAAVLRARQLGIEVGDVAAAVARVRGGA